MKFLSSGLLSALRTCSPACSLLSHFPILFLYLFFKLFVTVSSAHCAGLSLCIHVEQILPPCLGDLMGSSFGVLEKKCSLRVSLVGSRCAFAGMCLLSSEFVNIQEIYIQCIGTFQKEVVRSLEARLFTGCVWAVNIQS